MSEMTYKPKGVLFKGEMVRAILDGRKTQTRRIVKLPLIDRYGTGCEIAGCEINSCLEQGLEIVPWPVGSVLYAKETWALLDGNRHFEGSVQRWCELFGQDMKQIHYKAGAVRPTLGKWRPSIFMPKWASRIWLRVTAVKCERLQDISEADAMAEGILEDYVIVGANCDGGIHREEHGYRYYFDGCQEEGYEYAGSAYAGLWTSINGHGSWDRNPFVFAYGFERIEKPDNI